MNQARRIGLVGTTRGYGLAHQNRDIAQWLKVHRWLTADSMVAPPLPGCRLDRVCRPMSAGELAAWLDGLDAVMFVERPSFDNMPAVAQSLGVGVICVPNWEWLHPGLSWLASVDMMLCPTEHTARMLSDWKSRFGFTWTIACLPWPVDIDRFRFRPRRVCRRFVYVHGSGGALAIGKQSQLAFRRKGLDVLLAAVERVPEISLIVYAFPHQVPPELPANVEVRLPPADNRWLYRDGDVCIQPSLWEGLGLPLLECQAAGMPLITTDAPPMNEHQPWQRIEVELEEARLTAEIDIPAARILANDLAAVLRSAHKQRIGACSRQARRFVEREHSWPVAAPKLRMFIEQCILARAVLRETASARGNYAT